MTTPPPRTPAVLDARALTDILARIGALEGWREHQTALLADLLNGETDQPADHGADSVGDDQPSSEPAEDQLDLDRLVHWVHRHVAAVVARPLRGEIRWCPLWWEHPEAIFRFEALRRAWTELAPEPGIAMSVWIRDHLDPCLRELLAPLGPFADCSHNERFQSTTEHTPLPTLATVTFIRG
jgi:hypothetical protein